MAQRVEYLKAEQIDKLGRMVHERLDPQGGNGVDHLIQQFYANVAPEDVLARDLETLYGAVMSLRALARQRRPGQAKVKVFSPRVDAHGWRSEHTVVQVVNDDMPFLVDSLTMALHRLDATIHLIVHPILSVRRDDEGTLLDVVPAGDGTVLESFMHVEISRQPEAREAEIAARLAAVLDDVRAAVDDWQPMRDRVLDVLDSLGEAPSGMSGEEVAETRDFLRWIYDDHFTFLGYRSFTFSGEGVAIDRDSGLGVTRSPDERIFDAERDLGDMPPEIQVFLREPRLLLITKADRIATVHRPAAMDIIGVKRFDEHGQVTSLHAFVGLFTSVAYTRSPAQIPVLRRRVAHCIRRAGFRPNSHDGKTLLNILESYPRDELFQMTKEQLFEAAIGVLQLQERARVAVFLRKDQFGRFVSALVYVPRDRYDTPLRLATQSILEQTFGGSVTHYYTQVGDAPLARLHFIVRTCGEVPDVPVPELEARIGDAARSWIDRLRDLLVATRGEDRGLTLWRRYGHAFPASYQERHGAQAAVLDIERIEEALDGASLSMSLYRPLEAAEHEARLKLYRATRPLPLSDILPLLENMGLRVISEIPHQVRPERAVVWAHDFEMESADGRPLDINAVRERFHDAFERVWRGEAENDGFNRLVLLAGLDWRQVAVLRAYAKYMRQAGATFGQYYVEQVLAANPVIAAALVRLFEVQFDPALPGERAAAEAEMLERIGALLDTVPSADDDRILRRFLNLVRATLRTNHFQRGPDGQPRPALALKFDSRQIDALPLPRPWVEMFVCSPRVEAVHLRGGKVARGGIRWSDRREDFRTEILGLIKAQMVKNTVIVPVGAKGGFVVKRPPSEGGREALLEEGIACYRTFIRGLLDVTDNITPDGCVTPEGVVRRDGDDPYLVVAADKGTATFSDIANALSLEYGFWLGDAFASGGSHGYDHKAMGITARGAWVCVQRHFRELGIDPQRQPFTVAGVGDMSGDVFGNGLLRSPHARLVAAFNHMHIFVDPDPDPAASFAERKRLFELPRSQWSDYDPRLISAGGGVFRRDAKSVPISPQMAAVLGIEAKTLTPVELIRAILRAPVDLLFFGGIGTYVKSAGESDAAAGDRANDALRVDGRELRARIVGEGANLAVTQLGRIAYALAGGRINTDAIDNSAGVDTSDHEVNIKILLDRLVTDGDMTLKQRNALLVEMTDEVAELVLRDNYLQSQALSLAELNAPGLLGAFDRLMRVLEKAGRLNRAVEFLPDDEAIAERAAARKGLTRPEAAVLLAYSKIWLNDQLLDSTLPDAPELDDNLVRYFPTAVRDRHPAALEQHRLRRELVATQITNSMINRVGGTFVGEVMERTGMPPHEIAHAYIIVRDAFALRDLWDRIEALDHAVPAAAQYAMMAEINRLVERGVIWLLRQCPRPLDGAAMRAGLDEPIAVLRGLVPDVLPEEAAAGVALRAAELEAQGVPADLARSVAAAVILASANDIGRIAERTGLDIETTARLYFAVGGRFGFGWLRAAAETLADGGTASHWLKLAVAAMIEDFYGLQRDLTLRIADGGSDQAAIEAWAERNRPAVDRADQLLNELKAVGRPDLAILTVANRQLRSLAEG